MEATCYEVHASNLIVGSVNGSAPTHVEVTRLLAGVPTKARRDVKIVKIKGWINQNGGFVGYPHTREIVLNMGKM